MDSKQKVAIIIAVIGVLGAAAGGSFVIDQSTNIGQIGDINTIIQNQFGVDLNEFRTMCDDGVVPDEFKDLCRLI